MKNKQQEELKQLRQAVVDLKHDRKVQQDKAQFWMQSATDRTAECQRLNQDIKHLEKANTNIQLENYQLRAQRDVVIAALSDAQRRLQLLRKMRLDRKCGCGSGVNEDLDASAMPFTDLASEVL